MINNIPKNFKAFSKVGKLITAKIVFGEDSIYDPLFDIFVEANSIRGIIGGSIKIDQKLVSKFRTFVLNSLENPKENSLLYLASNSGLNKDELIDQVPHWIFPAVGIIAVTMPRLLLLLANHPNVFTKILDEINMFPSVYYNTDHFDKLKYTRKCILELFRLNNPVNSTFRTLLKDYNFDKDHKFKKGDKFLVLNNPVLREPIAFPEPNKFKPERWTKKLENSYYAIMFNQGPQKCPGKDLSIFMLQSFIVNFFKLSGLLDSNILISDKIDIDNIPQMINPCKISIDIVRKFKK